MIEKFFNIIALQKNVVHISNNPFIASQKLTYVGSIFFSDKRC